MMKTLTLSPSSDENRRLLPQQSKLTNVQEILGLNNENDNSNANTTDTPRLVHDKRLKVSSKLAFLC